MAVSEAYVMSAVTVGATGISVITGTTGAQANTSAGCYQLFIDPVTNMAKADEFEVRVMEKVKSAGTQRTVFRATLLGTQIEAFVTPPLLLLNGWDMQIKKLAGTDRAFDASIRKA